MPFFKELDSRVIKAPGFLFGALYRGSIERVEGEREQ